MNRTIRNLTLIAIAVSAVVLASFQWWFQAPFQLTAVYLLVALIAIISVPLAYRLLGYMLIDDAKWLLEKEASEHAEMLERLSSIKSELTDLDIDEGVRQSDLLTDIIDDYHSVVETRFLGKKHSPLVYLGAARRVQKLALQNLTDVVAVGHSMSSISRHRTDQAQLDNEETRQRHDRHSDMYEEQSTRVKDLLQENRKLFDALTDTAVEVANIQSFSKYDRIDTLARLVGLAELANKTGK